MEFANYYSNLLCGSTHVDAWGRCVRALSDGIINSDASAVNLHASALLLGLGGVLHMIKVDECKAPGATSLSIQDHLHLAQLTVLPKQVL